MASKRRTNSGFSLVELVIVLAIALLLLAVSLPSVMRSWRIYKLANQASLIANQIDILRFTAVRRNRAVNLSYVNVGGNAIVFIDANNSGALDATDPQLLLPPEIQIVQAGFPGTGTMGPAYAAPVLMNVGSQIQVNSRGTVQGVANPRMFVLCYPNDLQYGYRAVTISAMGEVRVWLAANGPGGVWRAAS